MCYKNWNCWQFWWAPVKRHFELLGFGVENGNSVPKTLMFAGFNNIFVCCDCGPIVYVSTVILLLPGWNSAHRRKPGSPNKPQCAALKQILVYISKNRSCNNKANPKLMTCKRSAKACSWKTNMREWKKENTSSFQLCPFSIPWELSLDFALGTNDSSMSWGFWDRVQDSIPSKRMPQNQIKTKRLS